MSVNITLTTISYKNVQEHLPIGISVHPVLNRQQTIANMGKRKYFVCNVVHNGHIKRLTDQDIQSSVLEIMGTNVTNAYITCPQNEKETLGIKLPFLVMIIKNVPMLDYL